MPRFQKSSWVGRGSLGACAAILLITGASGCRLGNRIENTPNPDQVTGLYESAFQSLTFCAAHSATVCQPAAVSEVPSLVSGVMTNPVALVLGDSKTGSGYVVATDGSDLALKTFISQKTQSVSYLASTQQGTLWADPGCLTQLHLEQSGTYTRSTHSSNGIDVSGDLALRVQVVRRIFPKTGGDCTPTLQALQSCYDDVTTCGGSSPSENQALQEEIQAMFDPYIQAGAMTAGDIPQITHLTYEVVYQ
jgi:hypothetical protein